MSTPDKSGREVIKVKLLRAGKVIRSYRVRSDTLTIGSEKGCTIRAAGDSSVLPKHATIFVEEGEVTLVPEPGAAVLLNGEEVDFAVPNPSDIIKIGRLTFSVEVGESADSIAPPPAAAKPSRPAPAAEKKPVEPKPAPVQEKPEPDPVKEEPKPAPTQEAPKPAPAQEVPKPAPAPAPAPAAAKTIATPIAKKPAPATAPTAGKTQRLVVEPTLKPAAPPTMSAVEPEEPGDDTTQQFVPEALDQLSPTADVSAEARQAPDKEPAPLADDDLDDDFYFYDDSADEEQDELMFEEPFDLLEELSAPKAEEKTGPKEKYCAAHVLRITGGKISDTLGVLPNRSFKSLTGELRCRVSGEKIHLTATEAVSGWVETKGTRVNMAELPLKRSQRRAVLDEGDRAELHGAEGVYKIDAYRPPRPERAGGLAFSPRLFIILGIAAGIHLVGGIAAAIMMPEKQVTELGEEETFAEVTVEQPEEAPKEEVKKEEPVKPKDTLSLSEKAPAVSKRSMNKIREKASHTTTSSSVDSLLSVLSKGSGKEGASNNLKDMVSNIDAVSPASGIAGGFNIAGAIASLPGGDVNIAKSGGGGIVSTLSGDQVAGKGTALTKLEGGKKKGKVRGKVTKMSSTAKVSGSLSKAEVARVVNANSHQLQACYEKALMGNPSLSGRVVFEWTITSSGKVKGVRASSSTLGNAAATNCMMGKIKRWKFPKPTGGDATIRFPFLFRSVSS